MLLSAEKNVSAMVKEGCVMSMVALLKEQKDSIEVQKLAVDVLKCLIAEGPFLGPGPPC